MTLHIKVSLAGLILVLFTCTASANTVTFYGEDLNQNPWSPLPIAHPQSDAAEAAFVSAVGGLSTEDFESITTGSYTTLGLTFPNANTATLSGPQFSINNTYDTGRYAVSGSNYLDALNGNFTVNFDAPITAFGFYGTDIGDFGGSLSLTLTKTDGSTVLLNVGNPTGSGNTSPEGGSVLYYAFYDDTNAYTSIAFNDNSTGIDGFGFDDFSVSWQPPTSGSSSVPEPTSLISIVALSLITFIGLRRRQTSC